MTSITQGIVIVLAIAGMLLYFPLNRIKAPGRWFFHDTRFDELIPIIPLFIIPYLGLFPYMLAAAILVFPTPHAMFFFTTCAIASWTAALVWYFFPAGILRKREIDPGFLSRMIVWVYEHDNENNTFPSSHVFYALICSFFLALVFPQLAWLFAIIGGLISISTVLVKQHHIADIFGGIIWAVGAILIAGQLVA